MRLVAKSGVLFLFLDGDDRERIALLYCSAERSIGECPAGRSRDVFRSSRKCHESTRHEIAGLHSSVVTSLSLALARWGNFGRACRETKRRFAADSGKVDVNDGGGRRSTDGVDAEGAECVYSMYIH